MPKFSNLDQELKSVYCLPSVRKGVLDIVAAIRRGVYRVHGQSPEGMDHILRSRQCDFLALFVVTCEHCDKGDLHYPVSRTYYAGDGETIRDNVQELFHGVYEYTRQAFGEIDFLRVDPSQIVFPGQVVVGALTYQDDDEPRPRTVVFGPPAMSHEHVLTMIYGGLAESVGAIEREDHDDDPDDDEEDERNT